MRTPAPDITLMFGANDLRHKLLQSSQGLPSGYWHLTTSPVNAMDSFEQWYLVLAQGRVVYVGDRMLAWTTIVETLQRFIPRLRTETARAKLKDPAQTLSSKDAKRWGFILNTLEKSGLLQPGEAVQALKLQILSALDQLLFDRSGQGKYIPEAELVTSAPIRGFELPALITEAVRRRQQWLQLQTLISSMDAIPVVQDHAKAMLSPGQWQQLSMMTRTGKPLRSIAYDLGRDPLDVARLFGSLVKSGSVRLPTPPIPKKATLPPQKIPTAAIPTILAVDDSDVMQKLIQRVLGSNYRVLIAGSAIEAFGVLDQQDVSLLLLDVAMPGIDGLELCRSIRAISKFRTLPIIMVTSRDGFFDKVKGRVAGATDYLTKPFESDQLQQIVQHHLGSKAK